MANVALHYYLGGGKSSSKPTPRGRAVDSMHLNVILGHFLAFYVSLNIAGTPPT